MNADAIWGAVDPLLGSHEAKLTGYPVVLHNQEGLDIGRFLAHLIGNVRILLGRRHLDSSRLLRRLVLTHVSAVEFTGVFFDHTFVMVERGVAHHNTA